MPPVNLLSNNTLLVTFGHSSVQKEEAIVKLRGGGGQAIIYTASGPLVQKN